MKVRILFLWVLSDARTGAIIHVLRNIVTSLYNQVDVIPKISIMSCYVEIHSQKGNSEKHIQKVTCGSCL